MSDGIVWRACHVERFPYFLIVIWLESCIGVAYLRVANFDFLLWASLFVRVLLCNWRYSSSQCLLSLPCILDGMVALYKLSWCDILCTLKKCSILGKKLHSVRREMRIMNLLPLVLIFNTNLLITISPYNKIWRFVEKYLTDQFLMEISSLRFKLLWTLLHA